MEVAPERSLADRLQAVWDESQQFFYGFTLEQQKQSPSISSRNLSTRTVPTTAARNRITNNTKTTDTSNGTPTTTSSPSPNAPSIDFVENQLEIAKQLTKSTLDLVKLSLSTSNDDFIVSVRGKFFYSIASSPLPPNNPQWLSSVYPQPRLTLHRYLWANLNIKKTCRGPSLEWSDYPNRFSKKEGS